MPYTPEQNGAAKQENRTIVESAHSMLHASGLPKELWAEGCWMVGTLDFAVVTFQV
jgi:hypothetical protein